VDLFQKSSLKRKVFQMAIVVSARAVANLGIPNIFLALYHTLELGAISVSKLLL